MTDTESLNKLNLGYLLKQMSSDTLGSKKDLWKLCVCISERIAESFIRIEEAKINGLTSVSDSFDKEVDESIQTCDAKGICILSDVLISLNNSRTHSRHYQKLLGKSFDQDALMIWSAAIKKRVGQLRVQLDALHTETVLNMELESIRKRGSCDQIMQMQMQRSPKIKEGKGGPVRTVLILKAQEKGLIRALRYVDNMVTMVIKRRPTMEFHAIKSDATVISDHALLQCAATFGDVLDKNSSMFPAQAYSAYHTYQVVYSFFQLKKMQYRSTSSVSEQDFPDGFNPNVLNVVKELINKSADQKYRYINGTHVLEAVYKYPDHMVSIGDNASVWKSAGALGWLDGYKGDHPLWMIVKSGCYLKDIRELLNTIEDLGFKSDGSSPQGCSIKLNGSERNYVLTASKQLNRFQSIGYVQYMLGVVDLAGKNGVDVNVKDEKGFSTLYLVNRSLGWYCKRAKSEQSKILEVVFERLLDLGAKIETIAADKSLEDLGASTYIKQLIRSHEERLKIISGLDKKYIDIALEYAQKLKSENEQEQTDRSVKTSLKKIGHTRL